MDLLAKAKKSSKACDAGSGETCTMGLFAKCHVCERKIKKEKEAFEAYRAKMFDTPAHNKRKSFET